MSFLFNCFTKVIIGFLITFTIFSFNVYSQQIAFAGETGSTGEDASQSKIYPIDNDVIKVGSYMEFAPPVLQPADIKSNLDKFNFFNKQLQDVQESSLSGDLIYFAGAAVVAALVYFFWPDKDEPAAQTTSTFGPPPAPK